MRVATYTRVSTARQDDGEKTSLTEQSAACDAYAAAHGWQIVSRFTDIGSGADRERPGFKALLDAARDGTIDTVLAWKPDRLYRALGPAADLADALEVVKAEFHSVQDSVDAKSLPLYAAVAALERAGIKERMALGKVGAAKTGKIPVGRPKCTSGRWLAIPCRTWRPPTSGRERPLGIRSTWPRRRERVSRVLRFPGTRSSSSPCTPSVLNPATLTVR